MVDLEYDPASLLPPCPLKRLRVFEEWLSEYWEMEVRLPQAYIDHIRQFHGGCPGKACFQTPSGASRMIGRFFNFLEEEDLSQPLTPTWRQWSGEPDVRLDYRVQGFLDYEFWCLRLEEAGNCLPIAGLDTAGHNCRDMDEINLLCLDYSASDEPAVVAWEFPGFDPVVPVAESFEQFLGRLTRCPKGIVSGPAQNW
jgi:SMI1-KNR4 cell-wall